jgi:hypothetical protein
MDPRTHNVPRPAQNLPEHQTLACVGSELIIAVETTPVSGVAETLMFGRPSCGDMLHFSVESCPGGCYYWSDWWPNLNFAILKAGFGVFDWSIETCKDP